jgi:magnesium-transporting ATPase (P-type)
VGTAFAARTDRVSLRSVGVTTNRLLLGAIAIELVFAAALIYLPFLHHIFGTAALSPAQLAVVVPYPFVVWGADEARRWVQRRRVVRSELRNPVTSNDRSVETDTPDTGFDTPDCPATV